MKVCILSESPADEAAIHVLIEAVLGKPVELLAAARVRSGGAGSIPGVLRAEIRHLHYRTDADGLVVVVDSDDTPLHESAHEAVEGGSQECRWCQLQQAVDSELNHLSPRYDGKTLKTAIGIASPAIEAWYRCGLDPQMREVYFARRLSQGEKLTALRRELKRAVYGTDRPSLDLEKRRAIEEAQRLKSILAELEDRFPSGFGQFVKSLRAW